MAKSSKTLGRALAVMAALLVVSGVGLFWVAWRGVKMLRSEALHGAAVASGSAAAMAGKTDWVGTWSDGFRTLTIRDDGTAEYSEVKKGANVDMRGTVAFEKNDVVVDAVVTKRRLHVDSPPHKAGSRMVMTLDGAELEKK